MNLRKLTADNKEALKENNNQKYIIIIIKVSLKQLGKRGRRDEREREGGRKREM